MNNYKINIKFLGGLAAICFMTLSLLFSSCNEEESYSGPITISSVYLEDLTADTVDKKVTSVEVGQTIRIEGSGFSDLRTIEVNGYDTYFSLAYVTDENVVFTIDEDTPVDDVADSVKNTIHFYNDGSDDVLSIEVSNPE